MFFGQLIRNTVLSLVFIPFFLLRVDAFKFAFSDDVKFFNSLNSLLISVPVV